MKKELLIIFVKNPIIGHVKTRLAAKIGDKLALKVYKELTKHTALITKKIKANFFICIYSRLEKFLIQINY